jgi:hypothetical protein
MGGKEATEEPTFYRTDTAPIVTDLATIWAVIRCVETKGGPGTQRHWGIVDWSIKLAKTSFDEGESSSDGNDK